MYSDYDKEVIETANEILDSANEKEKIILDALAETEDPEERKIFEQLLDDVKKDRDLAEYLVKTTENPTESRM
ncbi:MAG TPA: hypothetical protein PLL87_10290 [Syntrophorhabdaceae bacterium]|nr:hypothetical protein [Syntrophorhabdaceae bacterium]